MSTLRTQHWLYSDTPPVCTAALKTHPEDFVVTEDLGYSFSGDGEHQFLWVEKKLANTAWVAEQLAKFTGLPLRNVTYAGRKDKYAVTRQWFGLHAPGKPDYDFSGLELEGVKILKHERHNKKLRTGQLKGNHFTITLRAVSDVTALTEALQQAARNGVPNYFGEQRFGSVRIAETGERQEGGNLQLAEKMIAGEAIRNRNKRNMALSALRSWLFNEVISERIRVGKLNDVISGDALMLSGSHSYFIENGEDSGLQARYEDKDLSPTAPLWGKGDVPVTGEAAELELAVTGKYPDVTGYLSEAGLRQERRPVKIWPAQLEWQHNGDTVIVSFSLPSGCYATTVLRDCVDTNGETAGSQCKRLTGQQTSGAFMRILLSNDDSVFAKGIAVLFETLAAEHDVTVIAPDRNCSGASNALSLHSPLRIQQLDNGFYSVNGTPSDCVHLGVNCFLDDDPELVVSGINHGANLGDDVIYSGTVAAATEGRYMGLPAIAVSLASHEGKHFETAARVVLDIIRKLQAHPLPPNQILNVNVPDVPYDALAGIKVTRQGRRHRAEAMVKAKDAFGREIYWYGPAGAEQDAGPDTDFHAIANGYCSVTPLSVDMTAHHSLTNMEDWLNKKL